jgi:hypothetical protein
MKWTLRGPTFLLSLALLSSCDRPPAAPSSSGSEDQVRQFHERIGALEDQLQRQNRELAELRAMGTVEPAPLPGPSRQKLQAVCERSFGAGIASVLGITESPDAGAAVGEIRINNLAIQGVSASGRAEARIMHYNDGRWLLKSIRLYATDGARYVWDFEEEL